MSESHELPTVRLYVTRRLRRLDDEEHCVALPLCELEAKVSTLLPPSLLSFGENWTVLEAEDITARRKDKSTTNAKDSQPSMHSELSSNKKFQYSVILDRASPGSASSKKY